MQSDRQVSTRTLLDSGCCGLVRCCTSQLYGRGRALAGQAFDRQLGNRVDLPGLLRPEQPTDVEADTGVAARPLLLTSAPRLIGHGSGTTIRNGRLLHDLAPG